MHEALGGIVNAEAMGFCLLTGVEDKATQLAFVGASGVDDVGIVLVAQDKGNDLTDY